MRILRPGKQIITIGNPGLQVINPRGGAAAIPWYLSGGISAANCVAAYQPIGAASYAASKVNLANPGTYDAVDGVNYPTWDVSTGWYTYNLLYLKTGIGGFSGTNKTWSLLIRKGTINISSYLGLVGASNTPYSGGFGIYSSGSGLYTTFYYGGYVSNIDTTSKSVIGFAGNKVYLDGVDSATISAGSAVGTYDDFPISAYYNGTSYSAVRGMYIQAWAIYDTVLTAPQAAAISTAMDAL